MNETPQFEKFGKLHRLNGPVVVTEKIDGTNAQILITEEGKLYAGSRNRWLTLSNDNFGFAAWCNARTTALIDILGVGRHYGEFWGTGIQRTYGLKEKRFSLFNTSRFGFMNDAAARQANNLDDLGLYVVPVLWTGRFDTTQFDAIMEALRELGSQAAPGFMDPEGIVIYDTRSGVGYKKTFDYDDTGKGKPKDEHGNVV